MILCIIHTITNKNNIETFDYNRICCIYAYYEKNDVYRKNLEYFLKNGILSNIDYYFVINGTSSITIQKNKNIIVTFRKNRGLDFGAYAYILNRMKRKYDYYFFLNTSVRGPYLKNNIKPWVNYFLELFTDNVKVVGTTINIFPFSSYINYNLETIYNKKGPFPHVQSMFFAIDKEYFEYLMTIDFFNEKELNNINNDINYVIVHKEFGLSQYAIKKGWNINCILEKYKNIDYLTIKEDINPSSNYGDPYYPQCYFYGTIDKYDVIFFKINRFVL